MYEQIATFSANHACAHSPCDDRSGSHWRGWFFAGLLLCRATIAAGVYWAWIWRTGYPGLVWYFTTGWLILCAVRHDYPSCYSGLAAHRIVYDDGAVLPSLPALARR